ncbi:2-oxo-4-hydroxy-4-carboxy-5-ureidoimidazoline decarboxylase [Streptomyces sp. P1-3]|uniref:2-oxo-4-hydroxy-4-carboxy-5-ureidoimidazoline decarboxylase n=1 Tax=Streptomyces sp. P1-3 TaxID=3421658 RepID=UPI003D35BB98
MPGPPSRTTAAAGRHASRSLDRFNTVPAGAAEAALLACCGSRSWARRIAAHRPYPDLESLLAAGDEASYDLTAADLAEALACEAHPSHHPHHPHPARRPRGLISAAARTALTAAHAEYERKFGHVFVICLDAVRPDEALDAELAAIRTRLGHDEETETAVCADELRRIARGRLRHLAGSCR